jgi:hypothetical protein
MEGVSLIKIYCKHTYITLYPPVQLLYTNKNEKINAIFSLYQKESQSAGEHSGRALDLFWKRTNKDR